MSVVSSIELVGMSKVRNPKTSQCLSFYHLTTSQCVKQERFHCVEFLLQYETCVTFCLVSIQKVQYTSVHIVSPIEQKRINTIKLHGGSVVVACSFTVPLSNSCIGSHS